MTGAIKLGGHMVGGGNPPLIVAEMSGNHNGDLDRALAIVDAVAVSGASVLKLQTYTPDTLTLDVGAAAFRVSDGHDLWGGQTLHQLFTRAHTPYEWHGQIFRYAWSRGLTVFSSPFDPTAVELLEELDAPAYKIASSELVDLPLIQLVAETGKPLIISTGMATLAEIAAAVDTARGAGCQELILLACTASYPAPVQESNLRRIPVLAQAFDAPVGLSDHTPGLGAPIAAVALGACLVEKHVTLARSDGGPDAAFSVEPEELAALVTETGRAWQALGTNRIGPTETEREGLRFRRSLRLATDVTAGEKVSATNVRSFRPAGGLSPGNLATVIGRTFRQDTPKGTALTWDLLG